jgi:hypothetical protein
MAPCQTCKFFSALTQQCRINPPTPLVLGQDANGSPVVACMWPPTDGRGCGKHEPDVALGGIE